MAGNGDRRMHEGRKPGLDDNHRGHERHEEPVDTGADRGPGAPGGEVNSMRDRDQDSALGGDVATRSNTRETPADERSDGENPS
jgi:hypothetical protein